MTYGSDTKILKISLFLLYNIPEPAINPNYPLITSNFSANSDEWLSAQSKFIFSGVN